MGRGPCWRCAPPEGAVPDVLHSTVSDAPPPETRLNSVYGCPLGINDMQKPWAATVRLLEAGIQNQKHAGMTLVAAPLPFATVGADRTPATATPSPGTPRKIVIAG